MTIVLEKRNGCALLTLNRPEALNALSFDILREIGEAFDEVAGWKDVRALLITGAGEKAFCAGADIKELRNRTLTQQKRGAEFGQSVLRHASALNRLGQELFRRLARSGQTVGRPIKANGLEPATGSHQCNARAHGAACAADGYFLDAGHLFLKLRPMSWR